MLKAVQRMRRTAFARRRSSLVVMMLAVVCLALLSSSTTTMAYAFLVPPIGDALMAYQPGPATAPSSPPWAMERSRVIGRQEQPNERGRLHAFVMRLFQKPHRRPLKTALRAVSQDVITSQQTFTPLSLVERPVRPGRLLQVISDVDDTIKSSGGLRLFGVALGGVDIQYPRGQFYPGGSQFMLELARYNVPKNRQPKRLAVLTARAREFKFALELKPSHPICVKYAATGVDAGVEGWGVGNVFYGSVKEWICQSRKGLRKFRNFEALHALDSKGADYVFIGDTAEGDIEAGESMIRKYTDEIRALFMHYVSDVKPLPPCPTDRSLLGVPIVYFRTYVGAATKAMELGLLGRPGVHAVMDRAWAELEASSKATVDQWDDLLADMEEARAFMTRLERQEQELRRAGKLKKKKRRQQQQQAPPKDEIKRKAEAPTELLEELQSIMTKVFPPPKAPPAAGGGGGSDKKVPVKVLKK